VLIHISCPGGWSHGLDSPERGEGRWSQNLARVLGSLGHDVYASSAGEPTWGKGIVASGVTLVSESRVCCNGMLFDISIDAAWWDGKAPVVKSKKYVRLHFSPESRVVHKELPENHYLAFPYKDGEKNFLDDANVNKSRTFFLPSSFGPSFSEPGFDRTCVLWPSRYDFSVDMKKTANDILDVLDTYRSTYNLGVQWFFWNTWAKGNFGARVKSGVDNIYNTMPYNEVRSIEKKCKISIPIHLPSCVLDATFDGVATVVWECGGFFQDVADCHNLLVREADGIPGLERVLSILMNDKDTYTNFVKDMQSKLSDHTDEKVKEHFSNMVEAIF
jgi:hypothetical protein